MYIILTNNAWKWVMYFEEMDLPVEELTNTGSRTPVFI
jgi:hypothetical protein